MTKKVTQNVTNSNLEDLTDKWKKGKLPSEEYYVKDELGLTNTYKYYEGLGFAEGTPQEVFCKVPSYDEWQDIKKYNKAAREIINTQAEENKNLKEELQNQAKKETQRIKLMTRLNDVNNENHALEIENTKLKELLKQAKKILKNEGFYIISQEIDQVLVNNQIQTNTVACNKIQEK